MTAGRHYDKGLRELAGKVLLDALERSGSYDVDMIVLASALSDVVEEQLLASSIVCEYLSLENVPNIRVELGDASSGAALRYAYELVRTGAVDKVAVICADKIADLVSTRANKVLSYLCDSTYESYLGVTQAAQAALMTRAYMRRFDYRYEDIAMWSVKMHEHAQNNPHAAMRRKISVKDIMSSEVVSDPIRLFDTAVPLDGASCIVLSSEPGREFKIVLEYSSTACCNASLCMRPEIDRLYTLERFRDLASKFSPTLFELCDKFSIFGILGLEALGLSERGKAPRAIAEGMFDPGSKVVVNASGGLKCMGYTVGACGGYLTCCLIMELLQDKLNVGEHSVGLVCDVAGIDRASNVLIFRRES
ncbi:MAG: thiolase family protein [Crenarchaeota archaeon]|nr:thiolase family protein [Thermoproteota archaeon]